jgi:hypothetical protein
MTSASSGLLVQRADLRKTRWVDDEAIAGAPLSPGNLRCRIDSFALTSNNVTYAAFGEAMNYWRFFPADDDAWGRIPVWGFATVLDSRCEGIAPGERFYGYWPLATHAVLQPERVTPGGFVDGAEHRRELHAVYNQYVRCSADPGYDGAREAEQALLRPLYITSFLIDDFLADNAFFGARRVLLSSASSKTAYGTAFCLSRRRGSPTAVQVTGLTSPGNIAFTQGLGCYDQVLSHADVARLATDERAVYVDFSGSAAVRESVHAHFGDKLAYSCSVGGTHWDELGSGKGLPGPRPVLFFAPAQIRKRIADWGSAGLQERLAQAWRAFMRPVTDPQHPWLKVVRAQGRPAVEEVYAALLDGRTQPQEGHVLSL